MVSCEGVLCDRLAGVTAAQGGFSKSMKKRIKFVPLVYCFYCHRIPPSESFTVVGNDYRNLNDFINCRRAEGGVCGSSLQKNLQAMESRIPGEISSIAMVVSSLISFAKLSTSSVESSFLSHRAEKARSGLTPKVFCNVFLYVAKRSSGGFSSTSNWRT